MKSFALACSFLGLVAGAQAQTTPFTVTADPGIPIDIPDNGGGWDNTGMDHEYSATPFASLSVDVPGDVASITSVTIHSLNHTWVGDLHAVLRSPNGDGHNIMVRPGVTSGSGSGFSDDMIGDYTFVEAGSAGSMGIIDGNGIDEIVPGTYDQDFTGMNWVDGDEMILNTPLSAISDLAGTWSIEFYDQAGGDTGTFTGLTLSGELVDDDGGLADVICDPANANSTGVPGILTATGSAVAADNDLTFLASQLPLVQAGYLLNSMNTQMIPVSEGILCVGPGLGRHNFQSGSSGVTGEISTTVDLTNLPRSSGPEAVMPGQTWYFQFWFRDGSGASNFTNALGITFE